MNLLLLLSALLSALTGTAAPRVPAATPVAVGRVAAIAAVRLAVPARRAALPPVPRLPLPRAVAVRALPAWRLAAPVPLFGSRRRE